MLPETETPAIAPQTAAYIAGLSAEQKAAARDQFSKSYSPQEVERVFGPAPAQAPIVTQGTGPILSPAEKSQGYTALLKHATDKAAVIDAARREGINLQPDGKISDAPIAKEGATEKKSAAPDYKLQWQHRPDLPIAKLAAQDAQYRQAFGAVELTQAEVNAAFDAIQDTAATVGSLSETDRAAFFKREGEELERIYGEARAKELVQLHSEWFKRLPEAMQTMLAENYGLHSMRSIVVTAGLQRTWVARRGGKS